MKSIRVGVIGAASYVAGKLLEMLYKHSGVEITYLVSETFLGEAVAKHHDFLRDVCDLNFKGLPKLEGLKIGDLSKLRDKCDLVFLSKPHGHSHKLMPILKECKDVKVIDLSGDFRLKNPKLYASKYYGFSHESPELLDKFAYGLPELYRDEILKADWVANPGCYPTSAILGLAPLLKNNIITGDGIVIDAISGASGGGKSQKEDFMFINVSGNVRPYKIGVHPHTPEIEQELSVLFGSNVKVLLSPSVGGFTAGIISHIYCPLNDSKTTWEDVNACYKKQYKDEPFVRLFEENDYPTISQVVASNFCDIGFYLDRRTKLCVVVSCIDNTIKGAAGQAIQNLNIMCGFPEETGLPYANIIAHRKKVKNSC